MISTAPINLINVIYLLKDYGIICPVPLAEIVGTGVIVAAIAFILGLLGRNGHRL